MEPLAVAFWGAFFGTAWLMLAAALVAYVRSLRTVALTAALAALVSAFFAVAYLGLLPAGSARAEARLLAHVAMFCTSALGLMLLEMLGLLRRPRARQRIQSTLLAIAAGVIGAGWLLEPAEALALSSLMAFAGGGGALVLCMRSAVRGDRQARTAIAGVFFMLVAMAGLSWIALDQGGVPWWVHALSALAGMAYLQVMASVLWTRYAWLIELREVMAQGPSYDPVTRMRSHAETGQMLGAAFRLQEGERHPVGVIVVSISNLYALEQLHGRAAANHALFVCAGRLRRCVPGAVQMGRLSDDGFLLLMRHAEPEALVQLARQVAQRLGRPVTLATVQETADSDDESTAVTQWVADAGIGVLRAQPQVRPVSAVGMARAMSRTAWSYPSRVAWFDDAIGQIAELPSQEAF